MPCGGRANDSSLMAIRLKKPLGQALGRTGSSTTDSPSRRMATSSPSNRNALGNRTACELPFLNSFAVVM
jgi:hypothetical protein